MYTLFCVNTNRYGLGPKGLLYNPCGAESTKINKEKEKVSRHIMIVMLLVFYLSRGKIIDILMVKEKAPLFETTQC